MLWQADEARRCRCCKALKSTGNGNMKSVMFSNNGWIAQKSQAMRSGCPSITEISERKCGSDRRSGFFPRLIVTLVHCFHSPAWSRKRDSWQGKTFQNDFEAKSWLRLRRCPNFPQEENCQKLPTAVGYNDTAAAAAAGQPWGAYVYIAFSSAYGVVEIASRTFLTPLQRVS